MALRTVAQGKPTHGKIRRHLHARDVGRFAVTAHDKSCSDATALGEITVIYIIIDNKPVVEWIAGSWKLENPYARSTLCDIFKEMRILNSKLSAQMYVQWCRRGIWNGNERADAEAKKAVATPSRLIPTRYIGTGHGAIKTAVRQQLRQRRIDAYEQERTSGTHLLSRLFFSWDLVRSKSLRLKEEFKMLTRHQLSVLTRLRTGHSQCNFSQHVLMHHRHYIGQWPACNGDVGRLRLLHCQGRL